MVPIITQKEKIVKELVQGQDYASQLQVLLPKSVEDPDKFLHGDDLVLKILNSFCEALSLLGNSAHPASDSVVTSQVIDSGCSEDSGDSRKRPSTTSAPASCKRKKTSNSVIKVSPTIEDGHAWRKYGQKDILNAKYPRSYFRCTHKYQKGCKATKQVQRKEDNPNLYLITYIGTHSCSHPLQPPAANHYDPILPAAAPTIKEEDNDDEQHIPTDLIHNSLWKDVMPFDHHHASPIASSGFEFDTADFQYFDESGFSYF